MGAFRGTAEASATMAARCGQQWLPKGLTALELSDMDFNAATRQKLHEYFGEIVMQSSSLPEWEVTE